MMMRGVLAVAVAIGLVACGEQKEEAPKLKEESQLAECCTKAMEIRAEIPGCCLAGLTEGATPESCCVKGMDPETPDGERPECCRKALALAKEFPECCRKSMFEGDVQPCCKGLTAMIAKEAK